MIWVKVTGMRRTSDLVWTWSWWMLDCSMVNLRPVSKPVPRRIDSKVDKVFLNFSIFHSPQPFSCWLLDPQRVTWTHLSDSIKNLTCLFPLASLILFRWQVSVLFIYLFQPRIAWHIMWDSKRLLWNGWVWKTLHLMLIIIVSFYVRTACFNR